MLGRGDFSGNLPARSPDTEQEDIEKGSWACAPFGWGNGQVDRVPAFQCGFFFYYIYCFPDSALGGVN